VAVAVAVAVEAKWLLVAVGAGPERESRKGRGYLLDVLLLYTMRKRYRNRETTRGGEKRGRERERGGEREREKRRQLLVVDSTKGGRQSLLHYRSEYTV